MAENFLPRHDPQRRHRTGCRQELQELLVDALGRQLRQQPRLPSAGGEAGFVQHAAAEAGMEAEEAQNAQMVLGDARRGPADKDDSLSQDIPVTICKIVDFTPRVAVERVHGEVAATGVFLPVVMEGDAGPAAIGLDIVAERRHLIGAMVGDDRHRAVGDAGRVDMQAPRLAGRRHLLGRQRGGEIDLADGKAHEGVANSAARHPRLAAGRGDCREDLGEARSPEPGRAGERRRLPHRGA